MKPKRYILALIITVISLLLIQYASNTHEQLSKMQDQIEALDEHKTYTLQLIEQLQQDSVLREEFESVKKNVSEFVNVIFQQREQINQMREDKKRWDDIVGDYFDVIQRRYEASK